jgi:pyruvate/2-oxoglutarate dehydrogenase complex dihydrolipoamide acyltransferase (E2) component
MPLFSRPDADLVSALPALRRIMPFLMRSRTESQVFHDSVFEIERTRAWLKSYNQAHARHATLFMLFSYACAQALHRRPELNRFVSGGRHYQRRGVQISFVVKKTFSDRGEDVTVKIDVPQAMTFAKFVTEITEAIEASRTGIQPIDKETALVTRLPGFCIRVVVSFARILDACNLYPRFMISDDPMFASLFLANLGSVGVSDVYHHLYEYGTVSLFGAISAPALKHFVDGRTLVIREALSVRWTFDERVHDAYYAVRSLAVVKRIFEDPGAGIGAPDGEAQCTATPDLE